MRLVTLLSLLALMGCAGAGSGTIPGETVGDDTAADTDTDTDADSDSDSDSDSDTDSDTDADGDSDADADLIPAEMQGWWCLEDSCGELKGNGIQLPGGGAVEPLVYFDSFPVEVNLPEWPSEEYTWAGFTSESEFQVDTTRDGTWVILKE